MALAPPSTLVTSRRADVQLMLLPSAPRALKSRSRVHFHCNTMETVAELDLHGTKQLAPGSQCFARLKFPQSFLLLPGGRFIIRQFSPVITIGGGVVCDATTMARNPQLDRLLSILATGDRKAILTARIERRGSEGISLPHLVSETGWTKAAIENALAPAIREAAIVKIGDRFVHTPAMAALEKQIIEALDVFHKNNSLAPGIAKEELREHVRGSADVFAVALERRVRARKLEITGDLVRLPGKGSVLQEEEAESKKKIEEAFASAGLKVPALYEVIGGLKIDKVRAQKIITLLLRDRVLIKISEDLVFHRTALENLRRSVAAQKAKSLKMDVAAFKDLTGVSRKYAIPLLEYLDRERVTRRVGDAREIL
jgi:selenocysteine-specific elongation factor